MISAMHSATVYVSDQDRALDFYVNLLGFEKLSDQPFDEASGTRWITVAPPGALTQLVLGTPQESGRDPGTLGGYTGITFVTPDLVATSEALLARGVTFPAPPAPMPWGMLATWFVDPDGNTFFLTEA